LFRSPRPLDSRRRRVRRRFGSGCTCRRLRWPSPSFFSNAPATTEIYTLSLHDALPILVPFSRAAPALALISAPPPRTRALGTRRSEEHTSELQSRENLVCRLLLEKKN